MNDNNMKKLTRSREHRMICGVCGGLGEYFGVDPVRNYLPGTRIAVSEWIRRKHQKQIRMDYFSGWEKISMYQWRRLRRSARNWTAPLMR